MFLSLPALIAAAATIYKLQRYKPHALTVA